MNSEFCFQSNHKSNISVDWNITDLPVLKTMYSLRTLFQEDMFHQNEEEEGKTEGEKRGLQRKGERKRERERYRKGKEFP